MKISIIGAGNVGSTTALRLVQEGAGSIVLVDVAKGLAEGKACDLHDSAAVLKQDYQFIGTDNIKEIKDSDIVVLTAGLARKPGMTREDLLNKNSEIVRSVCSQVKELAPECILIIVTNPLDLMTRLALNVTGFKPNKVIGMGLSLDAARFCNLISRELNVSNSEIEACVIGSHGQGMIPLPEWTKVKGVRLSKLLGAEKLLELSEKTIDRGRHIVSLLGSASAYFAPSAAAASLIKAIIKDEKRVLGACAYLNGEYGLKDVCIGVPCRIGREGIEKIIELELSAEEKEKLVKSAEGLKQLCTT